MTDTFPPDFSEDIGRVRKYIPDVVQIADPDGGVSYLFSDDEIKSFIDDETQGDLLPVTPFRLHRAAAWAMIALGNNENLILKKITTQDQATDGTKVAQQLIAAANAMFARADAEEKYALTLGANAEGLIAVFPEPTHDYLYEPYPIRPFARQWL